MPELSQWEVFTVLNGPPVLRIGGATSIILILDVAARRAVLARCLIEPLSLIKLHCVPPSPSPSLKVAATAVLLASVNLPQHCL